MKHKGSVMEYAIERANDLMRAYDRYIAECDYVRMDEACGVIVNMPSRRFWVSEIRASLVVSAVIRGERVLESMRPLKREMYEEIHRRVLQMRQAYPQMSISELCSEVVQQPAPKFYMSPGSAKIMVYKSMKRWVREKWRRLRFLRQER